MNLKPINKNVTLELIPEETITSTGLIMESGNKKPNVETLKGRVTGVGEKDTKGLKVGDTVIFFRAGANEYIKSNFVVNCDAVIAVIG